MQLDFEIRSCSRKCAVTAQPLQPGDVYFSVLVWQASDLVRWDYCIDGWQGPPDDCVGWWRSQLPNKDDEQPKLAPTDVMLNLFESLEDHPAELSFRYLLGLLLLRRKILRPEESELDDQGREVLTLHCPRRERDYELVVAEPMGDQADKLKQQMFDLLYGGSNDGEIVASSNSQANP